MPYSQFPSTPILQNSCPPCRKTRISKEPKKQSKREKRNNHYLMERNWTQFFVFIFNHFSHQFFFFFRNICKAVWFSKKKKKKKFAISNLKLVYSSDFFSFFLWLRVKVIGKVPSRIIIMTFCFMESFTQGGLW